VRVAATSSCESSGGQEGQAKQEGEGREEEGVELGKSASSSKRPAAVLAGDGQQRQQQRKTKSAFAKPAAKKASAAPVIKPPAPTRPVASSGSSVALHSAQASGNQRRGASDGLAQMVKAKRLVGLGAEERAPATNVMEAQARGEELQAVDNASYALDGLVGTCSSAVRQDSAATLATICTNRRGLGALKTEGLMPELLASLQASLAKEDPVLALAAAAVLLGAAQPHADPALLKMSEAAGLAGRVLACPAYTTPLDSRESSTEAGRKLRRILVEGPLSRQLPSAHAESPVAVALLALASATDPHNEQRVVDDDLKEALREGGALGRAAELAVCVTGSVPCLRSPSGDDGSAEMDDASTRALWTLQHCMLLLEHTTFCCTPNVKYLSGHLVEGLPDSGSAARKQQFALVAAEVLQRLIAARDAAGARVNGCLRATMAVLMNLTHSNRPCAQLLAECGLGESAAALLGAICGPGDRGSGAVRQRVVASLEVVSLALGLLINLVEGAEKCKAQLLAWDGGVLELLANLVSSGSGNNTREAADNEVTADDLDLDEAEGEASIVEVYAAMLLGFLVEPDAALRQRAAAMLPGGTLQPVIAAVEKCLEFYTRTDTITEATGAKLRDLIASLKA